MKQTILFFISLFFSLSLFAQTQTTSWKTNAGEEKATKALVYTYDNQGRITTVQSFQEDTKTDYIYDKTARLKRLDVYNEEGLTKVMYEYGKEPTVSILHPDWGEQKQVSFKDERGKVTEKLIYHNQKLVRRQLFSYTAYDSLFGTETIDFFDDNRTEEITSEVSFVIGNGEKITQPKSLKSITYFDETTNLKKRDVIFIEDKKPIKETFYRYDKDNRLTEKRIIDYPDAEQIMYWFSYDEEGRLESSRMEDIIDSELFLYQIKTHLYKEGSPWQIISQTFDRNKGFIKNVMVFKDGKLIRERYYEGEKLLQTLDYQYAKL